MAKDTDGRTRQDVLESQISERRREIRTDNYSMSIGEISSLYLEGELIIRPEFQRFFRWDERQKSALIESILLGIPLPPIFVAQIEDGKWELVDGLQRVSTILQLQGDLENYPPLQLQTTKYLPALEGLFWEADNPEGALTQAQRLDIKRARLDVQIIQRDSSPESKYDLFQRLNGFGASLTPQELRNASLASVSSEGFKWILQLASDTNFTSCVSLSERMVEEQFDVELVLRFLTCYAMPEDQVASLKDFRSLLDERSLDFAQGAEAGELEVLKAADVFKATFAAVNSGGGEDVFRRFDVAKDEFVGSFLLTAFEVIALGVGWAIANGDAYQVDLAAVSAQLWRDGLLKSGMVTGKSTETRMRQTVPLGRAAVKP